MSDLHHCQSLAQTYPLCRRLGPLLAPQERELLGVLLALQSRLQTMSNPSAETVQQLIDDPVGRELQRQADQHGFSLDSLADMGRAAARWQIKPHFADMGDLMAHSRQTANPIGRVLLSTTTITDPRAMGLIDTLCSALQLSLWYLRLPAHLAAGRCPLPGDELTQHRLDPTTLLDLGLNHPRVRPLLDNHMVRCRRLLQSASPLGRLVSGRNGLALRSLILAVERLLVFQAENPVADGDAQLRPLDWLSALSRGAYHGMRP